MTRSLESKYNSAIIKYACWFSTTVQTLCVKTRIHMHPPHIAYVLCLYNIIMNKQVALDVLFCISLTQQLSVFYQEALSEYANYHHEFIMHTRSRFHHIFQLDQPAYIDTLHSICGNNAGMYDVCTNYYLRGALQSICLHIHCAYNTIIYVCCILLNILPYFTLVMGNPSNIKYKLKLKHTHTPNHIQWQSNIHKAKENYIIEIGAL